MATAPSSTTGSPVQGQEQLAAQPELPVLTPWKTVTPINTPSWTLERNPYSVWVDTDGNQLPYIEKISSTLAENLEVVNLRAIAGEYDMQSRHLDIGKLPVFLENQQKGNYKMALDIGDNGADSGCKFNLSFDADPRSASGSPTSTSAGRSRWVSTATRSTRRSGSAPAPPARSCRPTSNKYNPALSTGRSGRRSTSSRRTRCWTSSGWTRRTPRVSPAHRRQGPAQHRATPGAASSSSSPGSAR